MDWMIDDWNAKREREREKQKIKPWMWEKKWEGKRDKARRIKSERISRWMYVVCVCNGIVDAFDETCLIYTMSIIFIVSTLWTFDYFYRSSWLQYQFQFLLSRKLTRTRIRISNTIHRVFEHKKFRIKTNLAINSKKKVFSCW